MLKRNREPFYKKDKTTYFYWEIKKGKRTGKLLTTNDINKISEILVYPQKNPDILNIENILFYRVEYDWYYREIFIFFYYPKFNGEQKQTPFLANTNDISIEFRGLLQCVMEGELYNLATPSPYGDETNLELLIPPPVIKYIIKELFRMQYGAMSYKTSKLFLYNPKTIYNSDLLYDCLIAPFKDYQE